MTRHQLSINSARAADIAERLARQEKRSVTEIVERALEAYQNLESEREPASSFYARLTKDSASDVNLDALIAEGRKPHKGIDL
jgi:hypothetical protein